MSVSFELIRGYTDAIILAHLARGDGYGYRINKDILRATGEQFELKEATLYTAFRRLEQAGLICSYWGSGEVGARRRYYRITGAGREACARYRREWDASKAVLDTLMREP